MPTKKLQSPADPYATLATEAKREYDAKQARIEQEQERLRQHDAVDFRWDQIDKSLPSSSHPTDYHRKGESLAAFCEVAKREGYAERFDGATCTDAPVLDALSLIRAGLDGGEVAIGARMMELRQAGREEWIGVFRTYFLHGFLAALHPEPEPPKKSEPDADDPRKLIEKLEQDIDLIRMGVSDFQQKIQAIKIRRGGARKKWPDLDHMIKRVFPDLVLTRDQADGIAAKYNQRFGNRNGRKLVNRGKVRERVKEIKRKKENGNGFPSHT